MDDGASTVSSNNNLTENQKLLQSTERQIEEQERLLEAVKDIVHRQDDILFKDLFDVAASDIFDTLSAYSKSRSDDAVESELYNDTKWSVFVDMPDSFNTNQLRPIDAEIKSALVNNIISRWALIAIPNESEIYNSLYEKNLSNIRFKLSARNKPIIRPFTRFP